MPNHVKTLIKANEDIITYITTQDEDGKEQFDFNTIIPTPKNIYQGALGAAEEKKYGKNTWYHWNTKNWGTKWNSYDFDKESKEKVSFFTAWNSPSPVIKKLSELFPEETIMVSYADENFGHNCGIYQIENGVIVREAEIIQSNNIIAQNFASIFYLGTPITERIKENIHYTQDVLKDPKYAKQAQVEIDEWKQQLEDIENTLKNTDYNFNDSISFLQ